MKSSSRALCGILQSRNPSSAERHHQATSPNSMKIYLVDTHLLALRTGLNHKTAPPHPPTKALLSHPRPRWRSPNSCNTCRPPLARRSRSPRHLSRALHSPPPRDTSRPARDDTSNSIAAELVGARPRWRYGCCGSSSFCRAAAATPASPGLVRPSRPGRRSPELVIR